MLSRTLGAAVSGIDAIKVEIEVSVGRGIGFTLVGLPDTAVKESGERVRCAIKNAGLEFPRSAVVINMSPADIKKEGSAYDLPLAIGILAASEQVEPRLLERYMLMGELSLDGSLRPVKGALPMAILARELQLDGFILPRDNALEAAVVNHLNIYGADNLQEVVRFFNGEDVLTPTVVDTRAEFAKAQGQFPFDFADVKGQEAVKRALEVACAGGHNILLVGSPGSGKSMMAKRVPGILPPLTLSEALETTKIHSVAGKLASGTMLMTVRPFRAPHHTISPVALVGGGTYPTPGEISLAHNGVLFLDELTEFNRAALEILRQPLEDRKITITRAQYSVEYPCSFMLVASMNPCPCGYAGDPKKACNCTPLQKSNYLKKISGPMLDRIDIQINVSAVEYQKLNSYEKVESSEVIRERVNRARNIQQERYKDLKIFSNSELTAPMLNEFCVLKEDAKLILKNVFEKYALSARGYARILKVARTIADLAGSEDICVEHVAEAVQYKLLDII
mgnify:CR=1 FL=1